MANEGEGSREADENYRERTQRFLEQNDPEKLAREAAPSSEKEAVEQVVAELRGKARAAGFEPTPTDDAGDSDES